MPRKSQATEALDAAREAASAIRAHEKLCDERWREQRKWTEEIAEKLEKLTETTQSGLERMRDFVGTKVSEVRDRVDTIEKEAAREAHSDARTARDLFDGIVAKIVLCVLALGLAALGGMQVRP
jgi:predicted nuclease with TOPRIM domain